MKKTYRVYFKDGNQRLYEALHIGALVRHIADDFTDVYGVTDIVKIEEVEE